MKKSRRFLRMNRRASKNAREKNVTIY